MNPVLSMIAAATPHGVLGSKNELPWPRLTTDMRHFRETTRNAPLIVGRLTAESLPELPDRAVHVLSGRTPHYVLRTACRTDSPEVFVAGGAQTYRAFMPYINRIYLTTVHGHYEGDTHLPPIPRSFVVRASKVVRDPSGVLLTFRTLER